MSPGRSRLSPIDRAHGVGDPGHAGGQRAHEVEDRVRGQAEVDQPLDPAQALDVLVVEDHGVIAGHGHAGRAQVGDGELARRAGPLGELFERVLRRPAAEDALDRHQHEAVLGHGAAQLLERHAAVVELVEERATGVAVAVVLDPLQQSFGSPVGHAFG